jgi:VanZ like family
MKSIGVWYNPVVLNLRFFLAVLASAGVILSSPFIRDIRDWIRTTFPGHFVTIVALVVGVSIGSALLVALIRIRDRRLARYGAIVLAVVLGVAYASWNAQGIPEVDVVERFHFVEYGLVTLLFYRAWRPLDDGSVFVLPILAGLLVGTLEEWLQWFIPGRVGDMRDVFLNGAAIISGLLFSISLDPPDRFSLRLRPGSLRRIGVIAAVVTFVFALFVSNVHIGQEISDPEAGRFRSRYDTATLARISEEREVTWASSPPIQRPQRMSREDQYMSEALLHVQHRNRQWDAGNFVASWCENLILEKFYAPVLDTPSYVSRTGHRWPPAQRTDAQQRVAAVHLPSPQTYESLADAAEGHHFIRIWPRGVFWGAVVVILSILLLIAFSLDRRTAPLVVSPEP